MSEPVGDPRTRRRLVTAVRDSLRELTVQSSLLNARVSARLELKDVDLNCLDLISRYGPLSPTALARRAGLHPATMTGILDRLEKGGWAVRERDPDDRRAVRVHALRERGPEIYQAYAPMSQAMNELCEGYSDEELRLIAGFLAGAAKAGEGATHAIGEG